MGKYPNKTFSVQQNHQPVCAICNEQVQYYLLQQMWNFFEPQMENLVTQNGVYWQKIKRKRKKSTTFPVINNYPERDMLFQSDLVLKQT